MVDHRKELVMLAEECLYTFIEIRSQALNKVDEWKNGLKEFTEREYLKYPANYSSLHSFFQKYDVDQLNIRQLDLTALVPLMLYYSGLSVYATEGLSEQTGKAFRSRFFDFQEIRNALKHYTEIIQDEVKDAFILDQIESTCCIIRFATLAERYCSNGDTWKGIIERAMYYQNSLRREKWFLLDSEKQNDISPESDLSDIEYLAETGSTSAQIILGKQYYEGKRFGIDRDKAFLWFYKAARAGNAEAMYYLGRCYQSASGVDFDYNKGMEWIKKAADLGNAAAQCEWGTRNWAKVGITDSEKADMVHWLKLSADQQYPQAMWTLGLCYEIGYGVMANKDTAKELEEKAAELGDVHACEELAKRAHKSGDNDETEKWYKFAARFGSESAIHALERYKKRGRF